MLADYVMRGIDSLFSHKLATQPLNTHVVRLQDGRSAFNKDTIKKSLHRVIKKGENARSPSLITRNPSPISKSRLKVLLEDNKEERIRSVVKRRENGRSQTSPYRKIEVDGDGRVREEAQDEVMDKENNVIKYYREVRKSTEKTQLQKSVIKQGKKSRIFGSSILSRNVSNADFRPQRL